MRAISAATMAALTIALAGCATAAPTAPAMPSAPEPSADPATALPDVPTPAKPSAPSTHLIKIPAVVGKNHQLAQDTMQGAGLFNLREKDATGQGRLLIWDRNWVVVRQTPPAGRRVGPETVITLFSKKIGE